MRSISARVEEGKSVFVVKYSDYVTVVGGEVNNAMRLRAAVAAEAGASMSEAKLVKSWSETGYFEDEECECECLFEPSAANLAALIATEFDWEDSAIALAKGICPPETIRRILEAQEERTRKAKELLEQAKERLAATVGPQSAPTLDQIVTKLGAPTAVFRPDPFRLAVGMVLGFVLSGFFGFGFIIAAASPANVDKSFPDGPGGRQATIARMFFMLVGVLIVFGGAGFVVWLWLTRRFRVLVCPGGLIQIRGGKVETFGWTEIVSVHERTTKVKLVKGPAFLVRKAASKVYWVNRSDGISVRFDGDKLRNAEKLIKLIRHETARRGIRWTADTVVV
jgi:hypothetical protein